MFLTRCYIPLYKRNKPIVNLPKSMLLLITQSQHFGDEDEIRTHAGTPSHSPNDKDSMNPPTIFFTPQQPLCLIYCFYWILFLLYASFITTVFTGGFYHSFCWWFFTAVLAGGFSPQFLKVVFTTVFAGSLSPQFWQVVFTTVFAGAFSPQFLQVVFHPSFCKWFFTPVFAGGFYHSFNE